MFPNLELMNMSRGLREGLSTPVEEMWLKVICVEMTRLGNQATTRRVTVISRLARARTVTDGTSRVGKYLYSSHFSSIRSGNRS